LSTWLLIYAMLSAYCLAGCLMEHFAVFSGWTAVGSAEFSTVQRNQGHGSGIVFVVPKLVLTVVVIILLVTAPAGVPVWLWWASAAALAVSWFSSAVIQIPIQLHIRRTADRQAMRRLQNTDWIRLLAMVAHVTFATLAVTA
jgi:hypothetical protein